MIDKIDLDCGYATIDWIPAHFGQRGGAKEVQAKINELIDAINFIMEEFPEQTHALSMAIKNNTEKIEKIDPAKTTYNVAAGQMEFKEDPYAEQRKWAGKLCWFWEDDPNDKIVDVLSHIDTARLCPFIQCDHQIGWSNCEPVKPTDDIIFKGE